ncbi:MAG: hypothetical protein QXJ27_01155 [Thermoplasmata archaeon]
MTHYAGALEIFTKNLEKQKEIEERTGMCESLLRIAECFLALNDIENCKKHLCEAKEILDKISVRDEEALFLRISARVHVAEGDRIKAERELEDAIKIYESIGKSGFEYHKAIFELGTLRKDVELLEKAAGFFERTGNRAWSERARVT